MSGVAPTSWLLLPVLIVAALAVAAWWGGR